MGRGDRGVAESGGDPVSYSAILPGLLFQGSASCATLRLAQRGIRAVVLCAKEIQPSSSAPCFRGVSVYRAPFDDAGKPPTAEELATARGAAAHVVMLVRARVPVLVTCAMGLNRSGLVTGLALRDLTGWPADRICAFVRACRGPHALSNPWFVREIERVAEERRHWVVRGPVVNAGPFDPGDGRPPRSTCFYCGGPYCVCRCPKRECCRCGRPWYGPRVVTASKGATL